MSVENFYNLCIKIEEENGGMLFGDFDAMCLYCKSRIGAHGEKEFEKCAKLYFKNMVNDRKG